ncbi:fructose 1,6-bisphosphatase [Aerococcus urinaehominis]|uniref:Fructose-1,6-bisphosphatase class 3 n=1 Tax=Aerococcus urinaehominis TaxID=128944 RepID=A0A109RGF6_9LACT|nr:fructose-bisphosphatase class III [Aerococcus urinaehominis]AMB98784.1 fructose 1,6-bisphosphatase [Aerococcus urinaehominis]SDM12771.1 fructose-1,6-bisphosphatase-3 [Aerococcus urinaehominis]
MAINQKYLELLAKQFPTISDVTTEIINLEAIMELPKATEHFISDLHGEYNAVSHVLKNGSGNVKEKIREIFLGRLSMREMNQLATIVYYPDRKIKQVVKTFDSQAEIAEFFTLTISRLVELAQFVVSKYTRSKVRKAMRPDMSYIMEELLFKDTILSNKEDYYKNIIRNVIELDAAPRLISALAELIQELVVDHLHVLGDIYDRGPAPDKIIDLLMEKNSIDIQWGNHDVIWMGAAAGSRVLIANVLRICARYDNLEIIEDAYGISLRPLVAFAEKMYPDNGLKGFMPKLDPDTTHFPEEAKQIGKIQQAIAIIQFKLEADVIKRHPEFKTDNRLLLDKIDYDKMTITIGSKTYPLENTSFPTVDPKDPYKLTADEEYIMNRLQQGFLNSPRLHEHIDFLYSKGNLYTIYNDNLLYHGCIPMNNDGSFMSAVVNGQEYSGRALLDQFELVLRRGYINRSTKERKNPDIDYFWYIWQGEASSLFGKGKMTTFERYYIKDKATHDENKNIYYQLREKEEVAEKIMLEFGVNPEIGHIVNGHTPVKEKKGEDPIKANGKLLVIDGGFSKAYQPTTGLAGYTLLYNSFGMQLVSHQAFTSVEDAINNETDIVSTRRIVDRELERMTVRETDVGDRLELQVLDLKKLLHAYREGKIKQNTTAKYH